MSAENSAEKSTEASTTRSAKIDIGRVGLWTGALDQIPSSEAIEWVAEAEQLGYGAVWLPEAVGRDPFVSITRLLEGTSSIKLATGIANIYARDPMTMATTQRTIDEAFPGRFLLGLGVSHQHLVEFLRKHEYSKPLSYMRGYLERMNKARYMAVGPQELPDIVLAALGPKMLELAANETAGAHPYFTPPEHTFYARETMGPAPALYPEQMAVLETDPDTARTIARKGMAIYLGLPNYANNLLRLGFTQEDINGGPDESPSDRLVDAIVVWGTVDDVTTRVKAHFDAGADHVCVQVLAETPAEIRHGWRELAPALTALAVA